MKNILIKSKNANHLSLKRQSFIYLLIKYSGCLLFLGVSALCAQANESANAGTSFFFPPEPISRARVNAQKYSWGDKAINNIVAQAKPWLELSDEELWSLMFPHTLERAWMVWSDGYCPACRKDVVMYNWKINAWKYPWKLQCPNCGQLFPKNDFHKFYVTGLDENGVFQHHLASTFIAVIEPYKNKSNIRQIRRLSLQGLDGVDWPDAHVAVEGLTELVSVKVNLYRLFRLFLN